MESPTINVDADSEVQAQQYVDFKFKGLKNSQHIILVKGGGYLLNEDGSDADKSDLQDGDRIITVKQAKEIEKAINMSDLGINPTNDGKVIRLVFPELTEERRKDLVKEVKKKGEAAKVAVRNIRRDANDFVKKQNKAGDLNDDQAKDVSEDEIAELEDSVQKMTDKFIKKVDEAVEVKSKEILTV